MPDSTNLTSLIAQTDLNDVSKHESIREFEFRLSSTQHRGIGTYGLGNDGGRIDYLLLSPALFDRMTLGGIFRRGAWPGSHPVRWDTYPELKRREHAASDHHAIWADIDI